MIGMRGDISIAGSFPNLQLTEDDCLVVKHPHGTDDVFEICKAAKVGQDVVHVVHKAKTTVPPSIQTPDADENADEPTSSSAYTIIAAVVGILSAVAIVFVAYKKSKQKRKQKIVAGWYEEI